MYRNLDPQLHPLETPREFMRALKSAKLDRLMAKPFLFACEGHQDGIYALAKHPGWLNRMVSGAGDGELRVWCLSTRTCVFKRTQAHRGMIKGVACVPWHTSSFRMVSCGIDQKIHLWDTPPGSSSSSSSHSPIMTWSSTSGFTCIDHHFTLPQFITGNGLGVQVWDHHSYQPIVQKLNDRPIDTLLSMKYNPNEPHVLVSTASDRSVTLYDIRMKSELHKVVLE
ncbi:hypothetical protein HMI54_003738, partial [Coelomomyces lativittatus]